MLEIHAGNTCFAKCWKHHDCISNKKGAAEGGTLLITYYLANPYISNIWASMCFQHLAPTCVSATSAVET